MPTRPHRDTRAPPRHHVRRIGLACGEQMIRSLSSAQQAGAPLRSLGRAELSPGPAAAGDRPRFEARVFGAIRRGRGFCAGGRCRLLVRITRSEDMRTKLSFDPPRFRLQIPVIAAVNGLRAGGGLALRRRCRHRHGVYSSELGGSARLGLAAQRNQARCRSRSTSGRDRFAHDATRSLRPAISRACISTRPSDRSRHGRGALTAGHPACKRGLC